MDGNFRCCCSANTSIEGQSGCRRCAGRCYTAPREKGRPMQTDGGNAAARWQRLKALFAQCLEQPEAARADWVAAHCADDAELRAELLQLLAQRQAPSGILGSSDAHDLLGRLLPEAAGDERVGTQIGAYRLLRELGAGGMGRVYLA